MAKRLQLLTKLIPDEKIRQAIAEQFGQFVVIGPNEPNYGPVLWFDTNVISLDKEHEVYLILSDDATKSDVTAVIDDVERSVLNTGTPSLSEDNTVVIQINN